MQRYDLAQAPWSASSHDPAIRRQRLLQRGCAPSLTQLGHFVLQPGQHVAAHQHPDMWEIFHVLQGEVKFEIDGSPQTIQAGQGLLVEATEAHALHNASDQPACILIFGLEAKPS